MSIALNVYYKGKNGSAKTFVTEMEKRGVADNIRNKEGNLCYEYYNSLRNVDEILLVEVWKDDDTLHFHHDSDDIKKIAELKDKYELEQLVKRYVTEN